MMFENLKHRSNTGYIVHSGRIGHIGNDGHIGHIDILFSDILLPFCHSCAMMVLIYAILVPSWYHIDPIFCTILVLFW